MLYNLDELWDLTDGDRETMIAMVAQFLKDVAESVANINIAVATNNLPLLKFNAHRIKPAITNFQIDTLKDAILALEEKAGTDRLDPDIPMLVADVTSVMEEVMQQLSNEFDL